LAEPNNAAEHWFRPSCLGSRLFSSGVDRPVDIRSTISMRAARKSATRAAAWRRETFRASVG
jgi:hypothetical protein